VIGNGDLLFGHEIAAARERAGCAAVMVARGALIKPWIFREALDGYRDVPAEERIAVFRRYVDLALEHWGDDEHGRSRAREFLVWHLGFWCRYAPRRADGSYPTMQEREASREGENPLDALLARTDSRAHEWLADTLLGGAAVVVDDAPAAGSGEAPSGVEAAG
jgi:tRNA-dihydrouridine synthase 3